MTTKAPDHITITDKPAGRKDVACDTCKTGMEVGPKFGFIPQDVMIETFIDQHRHTPKSGRR